MCGEVEVLVGVIFSPKSCVGEYVEMLKGLPEIPKVKCEEGVGRCLP